MHRREQPPEALIRERDRDGARSLTARSTEPAVGKRGGPGSWTRAVEGAPVALQQPQWRDARWSFLYDKGTSYARRASNGRVAQAARRMRRGPLETPVRGPFLHAAVWTWEVPLYFWFGGIATGSSFVALAADIVGDHASARIARRVTLGAVLPAAPLLVMDLGRPERFLHMMRIFKVRSPMSMGAWCLSAFSGAAGGAATADLLGWRRTARAAGAATTFLGLYLGSYTGVLLAATAVPVWIRSRLFLPPIFVCTATATGAAANRLALAATGVPPGHPTRQALGALETAAIATELVVSAVNKRRLGSLASALDDGRAGKLFHAAEVALTSGLALRAARRRTGPWGHHLASVLYLAGGAAYRFAWVAAGRSSADDDEAVARTAREA